LTVHVKPRPPGAKRTVEPRLVRLALSLMDGHPVGEGGIHAASPERGILASMVRNLLGPDSPLGDRATLNVNGGPIEIHAEKAVHAELPGGKIVSLGAAREGEAHLVLEEALRKGVDLDGATFVHLDLAGLDLAPMPGVSLDRCRFVGCSLMAADMGGAGLSGAVFQDSDLTGASFRGTVLDGAEFRRCVLRGTRLEHAARPVTPVVASGNRYGEDFAFSTRFPQFEADAKTRAIASAAVGKDLDAISDLGASELIGDVGHEFVNGVTGSAATLAKIGGKILAWVDSRLFEGWLTDRAAEGINCVAGGAVVGIMSRRDALAEKAIKASLARAGLWRGAVRGHVVADRVALPEVERIVAGVLQDEDLYAVRISELTGGAGQFGMRALQEDALPSVVLYAVDGARKLWWVRDGVVDQAIEYAADGSIVSCEALYRDGSRTKLAATVLGTAMASYGPDGKLTWSQRLRAAMPAEELLARFREALRGDDRVAPPPRPSGGEPAEGAGMRPEPLRRVR
jgi:hypothetical protein